MKITNLKQIRGVCPSQWEARTENNHGVYIRYRWGYLSIYVSEFSGEPGLKGKEVYEEQLGSELDDYLDWSKVAPIIDNLKLLGGKL